MVMRDEVKEPAFKLGYQAGLRFRGPICAVGLAVAVLPSAGGRGALKAGIGGAPFAGV